MTERATAILSLTTKKKVTVNEPKPPKLSFKHQLPPTPPKIEKKKAKPYQCLFPHI